MYCYILIFNNYFKRRKTYEKNFYCTILWNVVLESKLECFCGWISLDRKCQLLRRNLLQTHRMWKKMLNNMQNQLNQALNELKATKDDLNQTKQELQNLKNKVSSQPGTQYTSSSADLNALPRGLKNLSLLYLHVKKKENLLLSANCFFAKPRQFGPTVAYRSKC